MHSWITRGLVGLAAAGLFAFFFIPVHTVTSGVSETTYLSLISDGPTAPGVLGASGAGIPTDCATWHELWPNFCANTHQDAYQDNGDNCVSACDRIVLDGATFHIVWSGPTYYMTCTDLAGNQREVIWEPNQGPHDPGSPVCEEWQEVYPDFGQLSHIDDWADGDGSQNLTPCDFVFSRGLEYHIDDIKLNIIIEPENTPVKESTWGWIKHHVLGQHDPMN